MKLQVKKAVIPAAGLGSRLLPATKALPKEMIPIIDKPAIQYVIEEAVDAGIKDILIITNKNKRTIEDHFDNATEAEYMLKDAGKFELAESLRKISELANIHYIRQRETKGLGHAIGHAKAFVGNEPFAIMLPDDIVYSKVSCMKQMVNMFDTYQSPILAVQKIDKSQADKYGMVSGKQLEDRLYAVDGLVEKPKIEDAPGDIAIVGRYIITHEIFNILENIKPGALGEIQLTDGLLELLKMQKMYAYLFEGKRYDTGNKLGYLETIVDFALKREDLKEEFMNYLKTITK